MDASDPANSSNHSYRPREAILAEFGLTVSDVGAIILVGGNIRCVTRTMTTTIVLQTSKGELFRSSGAPACKQRGKPRRAVCN